MSFVKQNWLLNYLPVVIFLLIAAHHFYLVHHAHLSPWLGGGYGMFSTTDYGPSRFVRVYGLQDNIIQEEIEIPSRYSKLARKVKGLPGNELVLEMASAIEDYLDSNQHGFPVIRVEVWATKYDTETLEPAYQKLNSIDYKTSSANRVDQDVFN